MGVVAIISPAWLSYSTLNWPSASFIGTFKPTIPVSSLLLVFVEITVPSLLTNFRISNLDNTDNGFDSEFVQGALEETGASASPAFSFSREGALNEGAWLNKAGGVASNRAGVSVFINNPIITLIACTSENENTYDVTIYEHNGDEVNLTELGTVSIVASRSEIFTVHFATSYGKQLAARITSGTSRNAGVDLQLKGSS